MFNNKEFAVGGVSIAPGKRKQIEIEVAKLYDYTKLTIPVEVIRGKEDGPVLFLSAAIHGDEINGVEIIKRILAKKKKLSKIKGTLIAVPIVNVFGFNRNLRYLPDRRDLNRCFPGSKEGSLAGQIAKIFMDEIVLKSTHGIDLHTAALHRNNLPQVRACLDSKETEDLAMSFGVPVVLNSSVRDGSLRQCASEAGVNMLLFEGGEPLRYEEKIISSGIHGILSVMKSIGMIEGAVSSKEKRRKAVFISHSSHWLRAPHSGSLRIKKHLGNHVKKDEILGIISNPFGEDKYEVKAKKTGIIIGIATMPLVNNGDALFHVATFENSERVHEQVEFFDERIEESLL
tara:strand:+ start:2535 stop:3566 length:1032 start_codon:yes stop_codon:yes gene_type:complete